MSRKAFKLGVGAEGPWENRHELIQERHGNPAAVGGWLNETYSVQLFQHPTHPGIDHLCIRRHDEGTEIPWTDLQRIKDRLATDGVERWGIEAFPPMTAVIDNCNLRHIWVMPVGWTPAVDLRKVRV
jgi:hypothetical protein